MRNQTGATRAPISLKKLRALGLGLTATSDLASLRDRALTLTAGESAAGCEVALSERSRNAERSAASVASKASPLSALDFFRLITIVISVGAVRERENLLCIQLVVHFGICVVRCERCARQHEEESCDCEFHLESPL